MVSDGRGWEEIHEFVSPSDCHRFIGRLDDAVDEGMLTEIPVDSRYAGDMLDERWFRDPTGRCWRFVAPDFPFKGVFLIV